MLSKFTIAGMTFYPYSLLLIVGTVVCFLLFMLLTLKRHPETFSENLFALQMLVISLGIAVPSAMLADSLFKYFETGIFTFQSATFYGGLLGALSVYPILLLTKRNRKVPVYTRLCDLAPCIPAGHCLGRIGCFFGGCCFGSPTDSALGVVFPTGSPAFNFYGGEVAVHPTQLYEAAYLAVMFLFLLLCFKKHSFPLYLILYGVGRFIIEFFRNDDRGYIGLPISPAQTISLLLIITGLIVLIAKRRTKIKL